MIQSARYSYHSSCLYDSSSWLRSESNNKRKKIQQQSIILYMWLESQGRQADRSDSHSCKMYLNVSRVESASKLMNLHAAEKICSQHQIYAGKR